MGEIVGAGIVSHVPTIMLPEEVRLEINEGKEISLVPGLHRLRSEVLDRLKPDTIVVMDTHWEVTFEHIITAHDRRQGTFTSHELPRGMRQIPYDFPGDPELAKAVAALAEGRDDTWVLASDDPFLPFRQLRGQESSDLSNIITPEAREGDQKVLDLMAKGDHKGVIDFLPEYKRHGPEGKFGHYLIMVGAIGGASCVAEGERFSDYEASVGTGQVHVWFERPEGGWMGYGSRR